MNDQLFRHIYESAPDGIVVVGSDGTIVMANAQAEAQFGYERGGLTGQLVEILIPAALHAGHVKHRDAYIHHPMTRPMGTMLHLLGRRRDGSEFPVEISLSPFEVDNETLVVSIVRDITARRRLEAEQEQLRATADMERERLRISMDLHDGILQSIYAVGLQLESAAEDVATNPDESVAQINRSIDHLADTIRDIRSYIMDLKPARYAGDLLDSLNNLVTEFRANSLIDTIVEVANDLPPLTEDQETAIFHVAQEALNNARKHSRATQVRLRLRSLDGVTSLEISDNGQGFAVEEPRIGDHQGMSNMLARSVAAQGLFRVESAPGAGTRVRMEIPVSPRRESI